MRLQQGQSVRLVVSHSTRYLPRYRREDDPFGVICRKALLREILKQVFVTCVGSNLTVSRVRKQLGNVAEWPTFLHENMSRVFSVTFG